MLPAGYNAHYVNSLLDALGTVCITFQYLSDNLTILETSEFLQMELTYSKKCLSLIQVKNNHLKPIYEKVNLFAAGSRRHPAFTKLFL